MESHSSEFAAHKVFDAAEEGVLEAAMTDEDIAAPQEAANPLHAFYLDDKAARDQAASFMELPLGEECDLIHPSLYMTPDHVPVAPTTSEPQSEWLRAAFLHQAGPAMNTSNQSLAVTQALSLWEPGHSSQHR